MKRLVLLSGHIGSGKSELAAGLVDRYGARHIKTRGFLALGFRAVTYRALDEATGETLWPARLRPDEAYALRDADPLIFAREFQKHASGRPLLAVPVRHGAARDRCRTRPPPRQRSSGRCRGICRPRGRPGPLGSRWRGFHGRDGRGLAAGHECSPHPRYPAREGPRVGSADRVDLRPRGALPDRARDGREQRVPARLVDALAQRPETRGRIFGHRTGTHKGDLRDGIPRLALEFNAGSWAIPAGAAASLRLARLFQEELGAFGYKNGSPTGVGEQDDMVIAAWHAELAILRLQDFVYYAEEIITMEDVGIEPVRIGPDY